MFEILSLPLMIAPLLAPQEENRVTPVVEVVRQVRPAVVSIQTSLRDRGPVTLADLMAAIINCDGLTVYPGMIASGTTLGLVEVSAVPRTVDSREVGDITAQISALTAVNPNKLTTNQPGR